MLYPWAQKQALDSKYRTVGVYLGPLGFGYNTELLAKKKIKPPTSWTDLLKPEYKGEIQMANAASSGTSYTVIATLVQLMGEDKAFEYMKQLHKTSVPIRARALPRLKRWLVAKPQCPSVLCTTSQPRLRKGFLRHQLPRQKVQALKLAP